ncbi:unnamed protein product [Urochloa decumbens]|uniref:Knottins-like domain-containing protein n=1 Tax=Urochloa decumbens TaxID=240449 RepID=A0ABC9B5R8_9POAL
MEPSTRKNLSTAAAVIVLLIILFAGTSMDAESSQGFSDGCNEHLSGSYKGACWPFISDSDCGTACITENFDNLSGSCHTFQCWCYTTCDGSKASVAGSAPIRP